MCVWVLIGLRLLVGLDLQALLGLNIVLNKVVEMVSYTSESKPLALPWGRTPRLDSGVRVKNMLSENGALVSIVTANTNVDFLSYMSVDIRYYELDNNAYPVFLDDDDEDMDLFAFINHADPTKDEGVNIIVDDKVKATVCDKPMGTRKKKRTASGASDLLDSSTLAAKVGVMAAVTVPFVTSFVTPTPERESGGRTDSIFRPNLRTRHPTKRFVISLDSSHHSSTNAADDEVTSIVRSPVPPLLVITADIATTIIASVTSALILRVGTEPAHHRLFRDFASPSTARADIAGPSQHAGAEVSADTFYVSQDTDSETLQQVYAPQWNVINDYALMTRRERKKFERKCNRQADLLKEKDNEIVNLEAQLSLKNAEAAEAIRLCSQVAAIEDMEAARVNELNSLKERTMALKGQVTAIESVAIIKDTELAAALESEKDKLTDQVSLLETTCFGLRDQVSGLIHLIGPTADTPEARQLHPSHEQLMLPVHQTKDQVVIGETSFSFSLAVVHAHVQRIRGDVASQSLSISNIMVPLIKSLSAKNLVGKVSTLGIPTAVATTTALSTTFVQAYSILPVPTLDYEVVDTKP
nr:hypothetical protein [Tanacetum cinerariifolium]